ncbi:MAG: 1,2-phenylacetyl-CoA epoxidase subunit PaaC [Ginsengibacter sp.]
MEKASDLFKSSEVPGHLAGNIGKSLSSYCLHLADNSLIMGQRLSEWTGHGPMLEQDIAMSNIALDLIGQSRNFYQYAAAILNAGNMNTKNVNDSTEDTLAYFRDSGEFKNIILTELPNGDWGQTILKLFFFSTYQYLLYQRLSDSSDKQLAAIAAKSIKEVTYHVRWSSEWVVRLGDGTEESKQRMETSLDYLWNYTSEMFVPREFEIACTENKYGVDVVSLATDWNKEVGDILAEATLKKPEAGSIQIHGKKGIHTPYLDEILSEMQHLQRTYPGLQW